MIRLQWQTLVGSQLRSSASEELLGSEDALRKHVSSTSISVDDKNKEHSRKVSISAVKAAPQRIRQSLGICKGDGRPDLPSKALSKDRGNLQVMQGGK